MKKLLFLLALLPCILQAQPVNPIFSGSTATGYAPGDLRCDNVFTLPSKDTADTRASFPLQPMLGRVTMKNGIPYCYTSIGWQSMVGGGGGGSVGTISQVLVAGNDAGTNVMYAANGSASAPGIGFNNNHATGLFRTSDNGVGFAVNGAEVARINQFGIGIGAGSFTQFPVHVIKNQNSPTSIMVSNNSVGVTAEATYALSNSGVGTQSELFLNGPNNTNYGGKNSLNLYNYTTNGSLSFGTNFIERARFDSTGKLTVKSTLDMHQNLIDNIGGANFYGGALFKGTSIDSVEEIYAKEFTANGRFTSGQIQIHQDDANPPANGIEYEQLLQPKNATFAYLNDTGRSVSKFVTGGALNKVRDSLSSLLPTTLPPNGAAGGDLTGTYPNPTIDVLKITGAKIANATIAIGKLSATGTPSSSTYLRGDNVWATVAGGVASVVGTSNRVSSSGGSNPQIDIDAAYIGQASINTLGTVSTSTAIGIGTAGTSPIGKLQTVETSSSGTRGINSDQYSNDANGARITMRKGRGTFASPTTVVTLDNIASWTAQAHDGTGFNDVAKILVSCTGTVSTGVVPGIMKFQTAKTDGTLATGIQLNEAQLLTFPAYSIGIAHVGSGGAMTSAAVSLTADVSGTLPVTNGGTGLATMTAHSLVAGNGTSTPNFIAPGTTKNVLQSNGTDFVSLAMDYNGLIEDGGFDDLNSSIPAQTYTVLLKASYGFTFNTLNIQSTSGTCTAAVQINGTNVTSLSAVSVSSSISSTNSTGANTVNSGDRVTIVISSPTSLTGLHVSYKTTRL